MTGYDGKCGHAANAGVVSSLVSALVRYKILKSVHPIFLRFFLLDFVLVVVAVVLLENYSASSYTPFRFL